MFTQRSSFTLLEFVVALPLLALLSSFFLFSLHSFSTHKKKEQQLIREIKEAFYFKYRLRKLMISLPNSKRDLKIEKGKLLFSAHQGACLNPKNSNTIQAQLQLLDQQVLLQIYDTEPEPSLIREETYFKEVDALEYLWGHSHQGEWEYKKACPTDSLARSLKINLKKRNQEEETFIFAL